jgi:hypothetical protein
MKPAFIAAILILAATYAFAGEPAPPSIDQVQSALGSTKTALAAISAAWASWSPIIAWVAVVAHALPWFSTPAANSPWAPVRKVFDVLAGNYGSATNAPKA